MKLRAALALTACFAVGVIAAGCGSSSDDSSSTSNLTKAEFIAKADAICQQGNQTVNQAAHQQFGNERPTAAEVQQFTTGTVIPNIQSQVDQIKALGAPSGDEDQINKLISTVQADVDKAKAEGNLTNSAFEDSNTLARQYGLKVCGKG
jgi:hypothetical protein